MKIGPIVYRLRWLVLAGWLAAAAVLAWVAAPLDPAANEPADMLPDWSDHARAVRALRECFPDSSGLSEAVVVLERSDGPLTRADLSAVEAIAAAIRTPRPPKISAADLAGMTVRTPASIPLPTNPMKSPDGRAALIVANVPADFVTIRSARIVDHIRRACAEADLPAGLAASVTGSSGFGRDYADAAKRSHRRTLYVTLAAVICILLLVYRAPLAALVPLLAISTAAFVAMKVLGIFQHLGLHVGTGEQIFVIVLIYGAGTDYSLLFISRFREMLADGKPTGQAAADGLGATLSAVLASAGTDTVGLLMLCFADYGAFRSAGPAVAVALVVAMLAAVTLVPAMVGLLGRALLWPGRRGAAGGGGRFWPATAKAVTARPGWTLAAALVLLAVPAVRGAGLTWVYDALAEVRPGRPGGVGNAAAGMEAAKRHWPVGQVAPATVLLQSPAPMTPDQWTPVAKKLTAAIAAVDGVEDVRSLTQPLGAKADLVSKALLAARRAQTRREYVSADPPAMRLLAVLDRPALTLEAMATVAAIRDAAAQAARQAGIQPSIHLAGATAQMTDVRRITQRDFYRVAALVLGVIFVMILALLRDVALSAFMVAATAVSYLATLGLASWAFAAVGGGGLDWKVEVFLFVVMVAVGVDYSIFLAARLSQEARTVSVREATRRAIVSTGPVISSCGLIMAATLGSLMAGELKLLVQLGFALALGMLIDTFIVRPLMLPSFVALTGRTGKIPRALE